MVDKDGNAIEPNVINWEEKINPEEETTKATIEEMYYPPEERFNGKKQIDVRKLNYSYFWVDYQQAAKSTYKYDYANNTGKYEGQVTNLDGTRTDVKDRSSYLKHNIINVYPDTLCWIRDLHIHSMIPRLHFISGIPHLMTILLLEYPGFRLRHSAYGGQTL